MRERMLRRVFDPYDLMLFPSVFFKVYLLFWLFFAIATLFKTLCLMRDIKKTFKRLASIFFDDFILYRDAMD